MDALEFLVANLLWRKRYETLNGKPYLVTPAVLIVSGVLNGSSGPLLYLPEDIGKGYTAWNGVPLTLNHPTKDGRPVSAKEAGVVERLGLGFVQNAGFLSEVTRDNGESFWGGKLVAEAWFDIDKTKSVDMRVWNSLERGGAIELSTGLLTVKEKAPPGSVHRGKPYDFIARNYIPDHVAILIDNIGACSIADGCGILLNIDNTGSSLDNTPLVNNQVSHDELRQQLALLLDKRFSSSIGGYSVVSNVVSVFDRYVVYTANGKLWRLGYRTDLRTNNIELLPELPIEVRRQISYTPVLGGLTVNRDQIIEWLTTNCACWKGADAKDNLSKLPDSTLNNLKSAAETAARNEAVVNAAKEGFKTLYPTLDVNQMTPDMVKTKMKEMEDEKEEAKKKPAPTGNATPTPTGTTTTQQANPLTTEQWLATSPPEIQSAVRNAMEIERQEKTKIVAFLTGNVKDTATKDRLTKGLMEEPLAKLRDMALLQSPTPTQPQTPAPAVSYWGAAVPAPTANRTQEDLDDILPLPTMNWEEMATERLKRAE